MSTAKALHHEAGKLRDYFRVLLRSVIQFTRVMLLIVKPDVAARSGGAGDVTIFARAATGALNQFPAAGAHTSFFVFQILTEDMGARVGMAPGFEIGAQASTVTNRKRFGAQHVENGVRYVHRFGKILHGPRLHT